MTVKVCPYCRTPAQAGTCSGCGAVLRACDLIEGDAPPVVATRVVTPEKEEETKESALTETVRAGIDLFAPADAMKLGVAYTNGLGVVADTELAFALFSSAAVRGEMKALYHLAECYRLGRGTEQDDEKAKFFYLLGAEKGDEKCVGTLQVHYGVRCAGGFFRSDNLGDGDFVELVDKLYTNVAEVHASSRSSATGSAGSGAIVTGDFVLTNAHVILSGNGLPYENIWICVGDDRQKYPTEVLAFSSAEDVAVLGFTGNRPHMFYGDRLFMRSAQTVKVGEECFTIGNPNNMGLNVTKGIISRAAERDGQGRMVLRTDMTINHGNSGGPLFDAGGNVLGLMTYTISEVGGEKLGDMSFAVTSDTIVEMITKIQQGENRKW